MVKTKPLAHCQFGLTRLTVPVSQPSKPRPPPSSPQVNGCPTHLCTDPCSGTAFQGWSLWHPVPCALVDTQASTADQGWSCPLTCLLAFFCVSHAVESRGRTGGRLGQRAGEHKPNETKQNRTGEGNSSPCPRTPACPSRPSSCFPMSMLNGHGPTLRHTLSSSRAKGSIAVQARAGKVHLCLCLCLCLCPRMRLRLRLHLDYLPTCTYTCGACSLRAPASAPATTVPCHALELPRWGSWSTGPRASPPMYLCPQACRGILDGPAA